MQYFISTRPDTKEGPFSAGDLISRLGTGAISPATPAWREGMPAWLPLQDLEEFVDALPSRFVRSGESLRRCFVCLDPLHSEGGVCHHCGRLVCDKHAHRPYGNLEFGATVSLFNRLALSPHSDQGLGGLGLVACHCPEDSHELLPRHRLVRAGYALSGAGLGLTLLTVLLGWALHSGWPLIVTPVGVALIVAGVLLVSRFLGGQHELEAAPLNPAVLELVITEELWGDFVVSPETLGEQTPYLTNVAGSGEIGVYFDAMPQERTALGEFAERTGLEPDACDWDLGYLALNRLANVQFEGGAPGVGVVTPLVIRAGPDREPIDRYIGRSERPLHKLSYQINPDGGIRKRIFPADGPVPRGTLDDSRFPVHIVPLLFDTSGRKLAFAITATSTDVARAAAQCELKLKVPHELIVDQVGLHHADRGTSSAECHYDPTKECVRWVWQWDATRERQLVHVTFRENLLLHRPSPVLTGTYNFKLRDAALSGIGQGTDGLYLPTGNRRKDGHRRWTGSTTTIQGRLSVDLAVLKCQQVHPAQAELHYQGLIPDHSTVCELSRALREIDVYVAKVTDNPPVMDAKSANLRHRSWDLLARKYASGAALFGADIHAVLSGEEEYAGATVPSTGTSKIELTVRSMVHNEETRATIDAIRDEIREALDETLGRFRHPLVGGSPVGAPPVSIQQPAANARGDAEKQGKIERLEDKLERLDESMLAGRVSEQRYEAMKAETEEKIRRLREGVTL